MLTESQEERRATECRHGTYLKQLDISWIVSVKIGWNWTVTGVVVVWGQLCGWGCMFRCVCDSQKHQSLISREFLWAATPLLHSLLWGWPVHEFNFVSRGLFSILSEMCCEVVCVIPQWRNHLFLSSVASYSILHASCPSDESLMCEVSFWIFPMNPTGYCAQLHPG